MKPLKMALFTLFLAGCSSMNLAVVNTTPGTLRQVEIKLGEASTVVPALEPGAVHTQKVMVVKPTAINLNYLDLQGRQYYASAPGEIKPGESGLLTLSITAKGTLDAVLRK